MLPNGSVHRICAICTLPLADSDAEGAFRADCSSLGTAWCPEWTEKREATYEERTGDDA
jgi:hypothetical protein